MKPLKRLNKYFIKYKHLLLFGALFITISNFFSVIPAQLVRQSIDLITQNVNIRALFQGFELKESVEGAFYDSILWYGVLILFMALLKGFFLYLTRQTIIVMSRHMEYDMKNEIYAHYQTLPLSFYRAQNTGDLMARISEDVSKVRMYLGPAVMYGVNLLVLFTLVVIQMLSVSKLLTLYVLLPLPVLSLSIYFVSNKINKQSELIQSSLSRLSTFVQEAFSGISVIKAFAREEDTSSKFLKESNEYRDRSLKLSLINALFFPIILALVGISTVVTVYVGGREVLAGNITVGNIAEFVLYVNMLTWPVTSVGWVTSIIQRAAASQARINEFMDTKTDIVSTEDLKTPIRGDIVFDHVSMTYGDSGVQALKDVSFRIKPGESLGIIGSTGSGKSTVAQLLLRMYDPDEGKIWVDGKDSKAYNITHLRSHMGIVPQDGFLFSESIRNNIAFGGFDVSEEKLQQAAKDADVYDNIIAFPMQFDTVLGERGVTVSGGQKQRITLARALVRDPKILILDDSLSAVDTKTEDKILSNLKGIMEEKTSIIISHRVSSVKMADKIIVLDDGRLIEEGTHDALMDKGGMYAYLYNIQSDEEASPKQEYIE